MKEINEVEFNAFLGRITESLNKFVKEIEGGGSSSTKRVEVDINISYPPLKVDIKIHI